MKIWRRKRGIQNYTKKERQAKGTRRSVERPKAGGKTTGSGANPQRKEAPSYKKNRKENKREKTTYITNLRATTVGNKRKRE